MAGDLLSLLKESEDSGEDVTNSHYSPDFTPGVPGCITWLSLQGLNSSLRLWIPLHV